MIVGTASLCFEPSLYAVQAVTSLISGGGMCSLTLGETFGPKRLCLKHKIQDKTPVLGP